MDIGVEFHYKIREDIYIYLKYIKDNLYRIYYYSKLIGFYLLKNKNENDVLMKFVDFIGH